MELQGQLKNIAIGIGEHGKRTLDITFSFPFVQSVAEDVQKMSDKLLTVVFKRFRKKRSLDANAYLWVLLQKMADMLSAPGHRVGKWEKYIDMLEEYGVFTHIIVKPDAVERMATEWRAVKVLGEITVGSMTGVQLQCYYGSHTYDTEEMSRLIDGVVTECRELGIETLPPDELKRMKEQWGVEIG
ncbi:hypothetical protein NE683_12185 [Bariatricus massiliensis]|uniref:Uncharacterized protein n=1 Tax=Bariatricus massiliensis TaxID=1745713 RepID=A0ABS8DI03_9FIRM|nr:hypothetical protein [Bariatricus massiliensis]MCB7306154.1 hypothetical protein [Bariatricus massiliensis]MCB7375232.1 hypothetical protein [Bariatricus massiliensis]MCB7387692.1 hypothetical protein [Bariatricus massiliensis]MCB7411853.1 hypothetical protein [Bariatricus massiliensis]MCQ5253989.1 hypothetical protein [Bariatricus massiliensis]